MVTRHQKQSRPNQQARERRALALLSAAFLFPASYPAASAAEVAVDSSCCFVPPPSTLFSPFCPFSCSSTLENRMRWELNEHGPGSRRRASYLSFIRARSKNQRSRLSEMFATLLSHVRRFFTSPMQSSPWKSYVFSVILTFRLLYAARELPPSLGKLSFENLFVLS